MTWRPIDTLPDREGPFRFRWADGSEAELEGYEPELWDEDGIRPERPIAWTDVPPEPV